MTEEYVRNEKRYWGFNWEVNPFIGQFGLFWRTKKGWKYWGIPFPFCFIAILWFLLFSKDDEFINFQIDEESKLNMKLFKEEQKWMNLIWNLNMKKKC